MSRERPNLKADTLHLDRHHLKFAHSHHPAATHPTATIQLLEPRVHPDRISPLPPLPHSRPRPTLEKRGLLQANIASSLQLTASFETEHPPTTPPPDRPPRPCRYGVADVGRRRPVVASDRLGARLPRARRLGETSGASMGGGRAGAGAAGGRVRHEAVHQWRGTWQGME